MKNGHSCKHYTDWYSFLENGNRQSGVLLLLFVFGMGNCFRDSILREYIYFLRLAYKTVQCLLGINVRGFVKL